MKKYILPSVLGLAVVVSCAQKKEQREDFKEEHSKNEMVNSLGDSAVAATTESAATGDNTQTSVDWNGTYKGTLPCADCPGIETKLTLNQDKTYVLEENYLQEKDGKFSTKGTFEFDPSGSFITLKDSSDPKASKVFFVGEKQIWMAENVGDKSMKDGYKLTK